ncbi:winged helix-turn-helix domain-containing protein [Sphaerobacter thermophilus]|uniref:winged helix-turn-helix domain-containing protein n=1 Tax=Sphaerobacter thermophilus TaxID=2057 RepID=UPI0039C10A94
MPATPDYIRIADEIVADVRAKKLKPGDKLPSIAEMVRIHNVGSTTIQSVYVRLEALRVIRRHQGKGIFVNDPKLWMREPEEE